MKKFLKWFLGLAAVGTAIGLIIAYFCKDSDAVSEYDCTEDMEEEDFDLDNDLKPVSERGYVHLNKAASDTADTEEEPSQTCAAGYPDEYSHFHASSSNFTASFILSSLRLAYPSMIVGFSPSGGSI